jgi:hypothetical protein
MISTDDTGGVRAAEERKDEVEFWDQADKEERMHSQGEVKTWPAGLHVQDASSFSLLEQRCHTASSSGVVDLSRWSAPRILVIALIGTPGHCLEGAPDSWAEHCMHSSVWHGKIGIGQQIHCSSMVGTWHRIQRAHLVCYKFLGHIC